MKIVYQTLIDEYYQALIDKNKEYEGIFYAAIHTTKIFCHASCPARKPLKKNVTFYSTRDDCLKEGYHPCKVCHPLDDPGVASKLIEYLMEEVRKDPFNAWKESSLLELDIHPNTARRHFKQHLNMTFKQFVRQTRIEHGLKHGKEVISKQVASGYDSNSGFNYALKKMMNVRPSDMKNVNILGIQKVSTPIGSMIAISDDHYLYFLGFESTKDLIKRVEHVLESNDCLVYTKTKLSKMIHTQIDEYFIGKRKVFTVPIQLRTSNELILKEVSLIAYGSTQTFQQIGQQLGIHPRTVGQANRMNPIAIIIPCHRLLGINSDYKNYAGGVHKKRYLIELENNFNY